MVRLCDAQEIVLDLLLSVLLRICTAKKKEEKKKGIMWHSKIACSHDVKITAQLSSASGGSTVRSVRRRRFAGDIFDKIQRTKNTEDTVCILYINIFIFVLGSAYVAYCTQVALLFLIHFCI